jgi:hypothetical protein
MACRPTVQAEIERAPSDDRSSNGRVHRPAYADVDLAVRPFFPAIHAWRRSLPSRIGSASRTFGPAVNPSGDIDTSSTTLSVANLQLLYTFGAAVRRRQISAWTNR